VSTPRPSAPARPRVLVVADERLGGRMAGPAIRTLELARALTAACEVTVVAPHGSAADGVRLVEADETEHRRVLGLAREHDVVVVQHAAPQLLLALAREPVRIVADLYTPIVLEAFAATERREVHREAMQRTLAALATADLVLCASERQRDLWLGGLVLRGLVDPALYRADPTLRSFVAVVPFGLPDRAPAPGPEPVLKGVWPGIGADDRVALWGGGIWPWLDAATPIRVVERLRAERDDVHLFFLGVTRPTTGPDEMSAAAQAIELARERGLLGTAVHVNEGWVPYEERERYLLEADAGVTAHLDHVETRFAFRTRILDYLWAGLPVVGTAGDTLADLVGGGVPAGDDAAFARALGAVLDDGPARAAALRRTTELRAELTWARAAEPLVAFCRGHAAAPRRRRDLRLLARMTLGQYPVTLARTWRQEGGAAAARHVARNTRRPVGRGR
jgi:glycosyltransferase involved in cell wall biosynthesis